MPSCCPSRKMLGFPDGQRAAPQAQARAAGPRRPHRGRGRLAQSRFPGPGSPPGLHGGFPRGALSRGCSQTRGPVGGQELRATSGEGGEGARRWEPGGSRRHEVEGGHHHTGYEHPRTPEGAPRGSRGLLCVRSPRPGLPTFPHSFTVQPPPGSKHSGSEFPAACKRLTAHPGHGAFPDILSSQPPWEPEQLIPISQMRTLTFRGDRTCRQLTARFADSTIKLFTPHQGASPPLPTHVLRCCCTTVTTPLCWKVNKPQLTSHVSSCLLISMLYGMRTGLTGFLIHSAQCTEDTLSA